MKPTDIVAGYVGPDAISKMHMGNSPFWTATPPAPAVPADIIGPDGYGWNILPRRYDTSTVAVGGGGLLNEMLADIQATFGSNYAPADFNHLKAITTSHGGDFSFLLQLPGISTPDTAQHITTMNVYYNGQPNLNGYQYFTYDGSGANTTNTSSTNPSGIIYLGRWYGLRWQLVRTLTPVV